MATVVAPTAAPALQASPGAHNYRITGLEITSTTGVYVTNMVLLGSSETAISQLPYSIELDRLYIHGDPAVGGVRGVALNSRETKVTNSWISDFKSTWQDAQAICGWNGPGPYQITNNHIEASGEGIMFGGAPPKLYGNVPSDIVIAGNHFFKPLSWLPTDPTYSGMAWSVKNLLELKNARRVTVDSNLLENNWGPQQFGFAIQLTARNEGGLAPWAVVEDVTIKNNLIRHVGGGINLYGKDGSNNATNRITIRNNVFEDIDGVKWNGKGRFMQVLNGVTSVVVDHNTTLHTGNAIYFASAPTSGFVYTNNISTGTVCGDGAACGTATLSYWARSAVFSRNVLPGVYGTTYPVNNYFPAAVADVRFANVAAEDYTLASDSLYRNMATDGTNPGATVSTAVQMLSPAEAPISVPGTTPAPAPEPASNGTAAFVRTDVTTTGSWKFAYGADGYNVITDAVKYPSYVNVTTTGQSTWTWASSSSDVRALEKSNSTSGIAACWYAGGSFNIDLAFTDQNTHQVALYFVDWDVLYNRAETVQVIDADSGNVLDTRYMSSFSGGKYLVWNLGGHVTIRVTTNTGNAVVSGLFFGTALSPQTSSATAAFIRTDTTTGGSWKGAYGAEGYNIVKDGVSYPSYVNVTTSGTSTWTWDNSTVDRRGLQKSAATSLDRVAACWYSADAFNINVTFLDQNTHQVALYLVDWDRIYNRIEKVEIFDVNGKVLDSRSVSNFTEGQYLVWSLSGRVTIRITNTTNANAVMSGIFFGNAAVPVTRLSAASFINADTVTGGTWKGVYGTDGYNVIGDKASYPAYVKVTPSANLSWLWNASTADARGLQKPSTSFADRIAGCWYSDADNVFTIDLDFADQVPHLVALYMVDWDRIFSRTQKVEILDANYAVIDSRSVSNFAGGQYLVWNLTGKVTISITNTNPRANAVVSGLFFQ